jgi:hypothetical protein
MLQATYDTDANDTVDAADAIAGGSIGAAAVSDSCDSVRLDIQQFVEDSLDSYLLISRHNDTTAILRGAMTDSANDVWNDSAVVALRKAGTVALTGNWNAGDYDITGLEKLEADTLQGKIDTTEVDFTTYVGNHGGSAAIGESLAAMRQTATEITATWQWDGGNIIAADAQKTIWTDDSEADSASAYMSVDSFHLTSDNPIRIGGTGMTTIDSLTVSGAVRSKFYIQDSLRIPQYAAFPATGSSGLFGADSAHDSLIAYWGGARRVIYPTAAGGAMSGTDIMDSLNDAARSADHKWDFDTVWVDSLYAYNICIDTAIKGKVGYVSLLDDNMWLGANCGKNMKVAGSNNVFIGFSAGEYDTSGSANVCIGGNAGNGLLTGGNNVCVGYNAGNKINSGGSNTCVGDQAGASITTVNYNTCIGRQAAQNLATGEQNTVIGGYCGNGLTDGKHNVIIGTYAGNTIDSESSSVFLGYYAGNAHNGRSNVLFVHNHAADSSLALIYGEFDTPLLNFNAKVQMDSMVLGAAGVVIKKIVKVGSHLAIILTGSDTLWAASDTSGF